MNRAHDRKGRKVPEVWRASHEPKKGMNLGEPDLAILTYSIWA